MRPSPARNLLVACLSLVAAAAPARAQINGCTPNFYFHASMAYAILRHNGVSLGKLDYIAGIPMQEG